MKQLLIDQLTLYASALAEEMVADPMSTSTPTTLQVFEKCRKLAEDLKHMRFLPE